MTADERRVAAGARRAPLAALAGALRHVPSLARVVGVPAATLAVAGPAQPFAVAGLARLSDRRPVLVVTATEAEAERFAADLACFVAADDLAGGGTADGTEHEPRVAGDLSEPVVRLPAWETLPFERVSPDVATMGQRLAVLWRLAGSTQAGAPDARWPAIVVGSVRALLQRLAPWREIGAPLVVRRGAALDAAAAVSRLVAAGYRREPQVEHRGELAVRGGIVDVFPSTSELPVRIDLFGDEVDRLTTFDVADQRSTGALDAVVIYGCRELVLTEEVRARAARLADEAPWGRRNWDRLARGEPFDGMESWLPWLQPDEELVTDLLDEHAQVVVIEPRRVRDRALEVVAEEAALADTLATTWGAARPRAAARRDEEAGHAAAPGEDGEDGAGSGFPRLHLPFERLLARTKAGSLAVVPVADSPETASVTVRGFEHVAGDAARLARQVRALVEERFSVTLCSGSTLGAARLSGVLAEEGLAAPVAERALARPGVQVVTAPLSAGFSVPEARVAVLSETDVTGRRAVHRRARPRVRPTDGFFDDLGPGSYVVHRQHGVARYAGMTTRTVAGTTRDYLVLEFRGSDRLYLPVDQIEAVTPYSGGESPVLSKMGGADWQRARSKARAAAGEVAQELVALYRRRLEVEGHAFAPDSPWQHELESSFPYTETQDQLRAIAEVKADMELPRPMDRLVCGDVGFGKTEVAVRAVFKAVQDGKQAAVLVPTTLLASQHYQTFSDRYAGFPVRVELLSRFLSPAQAKKVVEGLADGSVDVVVGTHRLLGQDVRFKDLGLLVVDEEQRFGVTHKEAVKRVAEGVDVLTLSANPIPRTLEMALTGIRDLSLVNTPPSDRRPILTYVGEYEDAAVSEAIRRELLREGQVFFVHNRVADIDAVASRLRSIVPEARVAVAHGQMDEGSLEQVVLDFSERKFDVLVCTTIIESGIDMPSVNTLVVDRADTLGLGQLHQIRGRVGRGNQRAYAYLFHPADRVLTEQAYERLRTIGEHTELGAGFKIAMRDLEIRGAGNLLGSTQSGHIAAVGYDLYVQMVAEAVAEARGVPRPAPPSVSLDVPGDASLPADYVPAEDARLEAYRRLAAATSAADVDDIAEEWADRYGPPPPAAMGLLSLARLRAECLRTGIQEVTVTPARAGGARQPVAKLSGVTLPASAQVRLRRLYPGASYREQWHQLLVPLTGREHSAEELRSLVVALFPPGFDPPGDAPLAGAAPPGR
ncbi:MAG: transcription-repair coupling factor [Actinomycetota bacterium]|nr:transcription-repair coupling factor [Actinomycetota bacterium]